MYDKEHGRGQGDHMKIVDTKNIYTEDEIVQAIENALEITFEAKDTPEVAARFVLIEVMDLLRIEHDHS